MEKEKVLEIDAEKEKLKEVFADCGIEDIEREYPQIFENVYLLDAKGKHFGDALEIKGIFSSLYENAEKLESGSHLREVLTSRRISPEKMKFCALVHDIGKLGPYKLGFSGKEEKKVGKNLKTDIYEKLWGNGYKYRDLEELQAQNSGLAEKLKVKTKESPNKPFSPVEWTIEEFVEVVDFTNEDRIKVRKILFGSDFLQRAGLKKEDLVMEMFRSHVYNSVRLLRGIKESREEPGIIDDDAIFMVGSHHSFDNENPLELCGNFPETTEEEHIFKCAFTLEFLDKYQAARGRGGVSHNMAINSIVDKIQNKSQFNTKKPFATEKMREIAYNLIQELNASESLLEAEIKKYQYD